MKRSLADLRKRIEEGQDLDTISRSLISPAEQGLLRCCAIVRTFDESLVDTYFRPQIPGADKESVPFDTLTEHDFVKRVPRTDRVYSLLPAKQKEYYDSWWESSDGGMPPSRSEVPKALRELSTKLLAHYTASGDKLDALAQHVFVDKNKACELFEELYKAADAAFDLARCRDVINVVRGLENVLGHELSKQLNDTDRYLQSRSLWATEYYQTVSYYERKEVSNELESFLDSKKKWILHLHAPGGMGKTMFLRWLIARRCVPRPHTIPCARVDFDFVDRITTSQHRWRLFLELARELEVQIPGNFFHSLIGKFTEYERILEHQQTQSQTSPTPTQLPPSEKLEEEILFLFGNALRDASLEEPVILIFDTLEEVILYHPDDLLAIVRKVDELRKTVPNILLVLSGRYDLSEAGPNSVNRLPQFNAEFGEEVVQTVRVEPFADEEALGFLQLRGLTKDRPLDIVVKRADGNPFKLALFADILLDDPNITEETIRSYPSADLLYLIERVLARIPNKTLHWLLRYGVVPQKLTLTFVKDVLKKHLQKAISGDDSNDNPARCDMLTPRVQAAVREKKIFLTNLSLQGQDLDVDQLWTELQNYASKFAWVTMEASDPHTVSFHGDVVNPMRRWLENEPVYRQLHEDAIAYFENKAGSDPENWAKAMRNAVYHKFQLEGAEAAAYWRQLVNNEEDPFRRRELATEIVGSEYVDDNFQSRRLLNGSEIITRTTLAQAYYELARASVHIARTQSAAPDDQLWSDAESDLQKCEWLQQELYEPAVSTSHVTAIRAAVLTSQGHANQSIPMLERALELELDETTRLSLEIELATAFKFYGNYAQAIFYWQRGLDRAQRLGLGAIVTVLIRKNLSRAHRDLFDLESSAGELRMALQSLQKDDDKTRAELLDEMTEVYFEMGQFTRARATFEELRNLLPDSNRAITEMRYLNQRARFLMAVGNPKQVFDLRFEAQWEAEGGSGKNASNKLEIEALEQRGTLHRMLFEIDDAREAFESARSRWHQIGDSKAAQRCMLKKAELFLNAGEIFQATSILGEASRLSIAYDPEEWLEETLISLGILHFTDQTREYKATAELLDKRAAAEEWRPDLRVKIALRTAASKPSVKNKQAATKFFSDLTEVLKEIRPASARMLFLDPLVAYPSYPNIDYYTAQALIDLFPLNRDDDEFQVNGPRFAELLRVLGRKDQAVSLLMDLIKNNAGDNSYALRSVLLTLARTSPQRGKMADLAEFRKAFFYDYGTFPVLCGATLIELAELSFGTRSKLDRLALLDEAEQALKNENAPQWRARLVALRGRLTIKENREEALGQLDHAIRIYESLGNIVAAKKLKRFVAKEENALNAGASSNDAVTSNELSEAEQEIGRTTIHIESNWTESVTINTTFPDQIVTTRHVPIEPQSLLDRLLAFDTYENYSFSFLREMDHDWISACRGLGQILMDEKQAQQIQAVVNGNEQKSALRLIIDALQLSSAPWEMMVLPSHTDGPASVAPAVSYFYRALTQDGGSARDISWLQATLMGKGHSDGIPGRATEDAIRTFQRQQDIPDHGRFDGLTRRKLKQRLLSDAMYGLPRVLLLRPSIERQRATSRGHQVFGLSAEEWYRRHNCRDIVIVEDPHVAQVQEILAKFEPDVVHILPTMEESTSIGIFLDFGSGGSGVMPRSSNAKSGRRKGSDTPTGEVQFLTLSTLAEMMRGRQTGLSPRPLLILDVLEPAGQTELFTQLFLRNAFAAQLYQLGVFESIIATGLTPPGLQEEATRTLVTALASFTSVGETVNRLRQIADLDSYSRLPRVGNNLGPLRDPADRNYLSTVVATAGTALFTQDPEM